MGRYDDQPTVVYRFFGASGELLYVGVAFNPSWRFEEHRAFKPWHQIVRIELTWYPNRPEALAAEANAIKVEAPLWNVNGAVVSGVAKSKYPYVMKWIRGQVAEGTWPAGTKMMTASALNRFDPRIAPSTYRRALRELIAAGDLIGQLGKGVYVAEDKADPSG